MNKHTTISIPLDTIEARRATRAAQHIERAHALAKQASMYAGIVDARQGEFTPSVQHQRLALCNAIIALIDDGDALAEQEHLMAELQVDEEGFRVDEDGFRVGEGW